MSKVREKVKWVDEDTLSVTLSWRHRGLKGVLGLCSGKRCFIGSGRKWLDIHTTEAAPVFLVQKLSELYRDADFKRKMSGRVGA